MSIYFSEDFGFDIEEEVSNEYWLVGCMEYRYGPWCDQSEEVKVWYENFIKRKTEVKIDWFELLKKCDIKFDPNLNMPIESRDLFKIWWVGSDWEKSYNDHIFNVLNEVEIEKYFKEEVSGLDIVEFINDDDSGFDCESIEDFIDKCEITFEETLSHYFTDYIEWVSNSETSSPLSRVMNRVLSSINYFVLDNIWPWVYDNEDNLDTLRKVSGVNFRFNGQLGFVGIFKILSYQLDNCIEWEEK